MKPVQKQRQKVVPLAEGSVLEIGIGSGLNLAYYDPQKIERVIGLDPAEEMLTYAKRKSRSLPFAVEYLAPEGASIPLAPESVDWEDMAASLAGQASSSNGFVESSTPAQPGCRLTE